MDSPADVNASSQPSSMVQQLLNELEDLVETARSNSSRLMAQRGRLLLDLPPTPQNASAGLDGAEPNRVAVSFSDIGAAVERLRSAINETREHTLALAKIV